MQVSIRVLCVLVLTAGILLCPNHSSQAQSKKKAKTEQDRSSEEEIPEEYRDKDPFDQPAIERYTSTLPLPFGFIAEVSPGLIGGIQSRAGDFDFSDFDFVSPKLDFQVYYDAWSFGYSSKQYGDVFTIASRSIGRDVDYVSVALEIGSLTQEREVPAIIDPDLVTELSASVIGVEFIGSRGEVSDLGVVFDGTVSIGLASSDVDDCIYGSFGTGAALRLPAGDMSLKLGLNAELGFLPFLGIAELVDNNQVRSGVFTEFVAVISLTTAIAFNFEIE